MSRILRFTGLLYLGFAEKVVCEGREHFDKLSASQGTVSAIWISKIRQILQSVKSVILTAISITQFDCERRTNGNKSCKITS